MLHKKVKKIVSHPMHFVQISQLEKELKETKSEQNRDWKTRFENPRKIYNNTYLTGLIMKFNINLQ